jgi:hypothetical protein
LLPASNFCNYNKFATNYENGTLPMRHGNYLVSYEIMVQ